MVEVRKNVMASLFQCDVCSLKLTSYAELKVACLPLRYTNTYKYDPTDYFGFDIEPMRETGFIEEYSNYYKDFKINTFNNDKDSLSL